jgi:hypothetical protein
MLVLGVLFFPIRIPVYRAQPAVGKEILEARKVFITVSNGI